MGETYSRFAQDFFHHCIPVLFLASFLVIMEDALRHGALVRPGPESARA